MFLQIDWQTLKEDEWSQELEAWYCDYLMQYAIAQILDQYQHKLILQLQGLKNLN